MSEIISHPEHSHYIYAIYRVDRKKTYKWLLCVAFIPFNSLSFNGTWGEIPPFIGYIYIVLGVQ